MKKLFCLLTIFLSTLFLLTGCVNKPIQTADNVLEMPISAPLNHITVAELPTLPIKNLTDESIPSEVMMAYVKTVEILKEDDSMLRAILAARD